MQGRLVGQHRHGCATTTHAVRAAIQRSQASTAEPSRGLAINPKTVAKWRKRQTVEDRKTGTRVTAHHPRRSSAGRDLAHDMVFAFAFAFHAFFPDGTWMLEDGPR
ncbi:MAG: hypothetical protein ACLFRZ_06885 [Rhodosalinus sp.]